MKLKNLAETHINNISAVLSKLHEDGLKQSRMHGCHNCVIIYSWYEIKFTFTAILVSYQVYNSHLGC